MDNHVIPAMGNIRMTEIKRSHIQSLYYEEAAASTSIARLVKTVMNTSMQYAVNKKIISINPTIDVALPKQVEKKAYHTRNIDTQKTLNMEQVLTLIEASRKSDWKYKKLLEDNGLPDIRWHDLRSTFCTILLKNNFNPKAVSQLMGHAKEIITLDVYGDTAEIIEDCLDDLQPFIDEVIPKEESEGGTDFSEDNYIEQISEFLAWN